MHACACRGGMRLRMFTYVCACVPLILSLVSQVPACTGVYLIYTQRGILLIKHMHLHKPVSTFRICLIIVSVFYKASCLRPEEKWHEMALHLSLSAQNTLVVWSTFSGGLSYKMECLVLLAFGVFWGVVVSPREEYCTESGWRQFPPGADEDRDAHKNARANRVGSYLCLFYPQWSVEGNALVYCHHDNRGHPAPHNRNLFIYARVSEFHYVNSMDVSSSILTECYLCVL